MALELAGPVPAVGPAFTAEGSATCAAACNQNKPAVAAKIEVILTFCVGKTPA
jgi:hypothetical protein